MPDLTEIQKRVLWTLRQTVRARQPANALWAGLLTWRQAWRTPHVHREKALIQLRALQAKDLVDRMKVPDTENDWGWFPTPRGDLEINKMEPSDDSRRGRSRSSVMAKIKRL